MTEQLVILLTPGEHDPVLQAAVGHLSGLAQSGLLRPFWSLDASSATDDHPASDLHGPSGARRADLFESLSEVREPGILRLVTVASCEDPEVVTGLAQVARLLESRLQRLAPRSTPVVGIRAIAPEAVAKASHLAELFSPVAQVNLVLSVQDRGSHNQFANPLHRESPKFAASIACEIAAHAGLWAVLEHSWVDLQQAGVIADGDVKVHFAQSQCRLADLPPPMLDEALGAQLVYPTPPGVEPAPDPAEAAVRLAELLFREVDDLHFKGVEEPPDRRERLGPIATLRRIIREAARYLSEVPRSLVTSVLSDGRRVSAASLAHVLGDDRTIDVVMPGEWEEDPSQLDIPDVEALAAAAVPRRGLVNQAVWTRVADEVLAAVDGGSTGRPERLLSDGPQRLAILDPEVIAARPAGTAAATADEIASERAGDPDGTLLGQFAARLKSEITAAESAQAEAHDEFLQLRERLLKSSRKHLPGWIHLMTGLLLAALVVTIALPGRGASWLGLDDWSRTTRITAGIVVAVLAVVLGAACLAAAIEGAKRRAASVAALPQDHLEQPEASQPVPAPGAGPTGRSASSGVIGDGAAAEEAAATPPIVWSKPPKKTGPRSVPVKALWGSYLGLIGVAAIASFSLFRTRWDIGRFGILRVGEFIAIKAVCLALFGVISYALSVRGSQTAAAARRITLSTLIVYATLALIAGVADTQGWYGTAEVNNFVFRRAMLVIGGLLLCLFIAIIVLRTRSRLQFASTRVRLLWSIDGVFTAATEAQRLRIAENQYLGMATALCRMVWSPFGVNASQSTREQLPIDIPPVQKLRVEHFEADKEQLPVIHARVRRDLAEPGWLRRQYEVAVDAFHTYYALQTGRDPGSAGRFRPETDRTTGVRREGLRWEFADQLHGGGFDATLKTAAVSSVRDTVLRDLLTTDGLLVSTGGALPNFLSAVPGGAPAGLSPELFTRMPLPVAGDDRTVMNSELWWPDAASDELLAGFDGPVHRVGPMTTDTATLVMTLRIERSQVFPLHQLPFVATQASVPVGAPVYGGTDEELDM